MALGKEEAKMIDILKSLGTGIVVGLMFALTGASIPAPAVFAGIAGIIGIYVGYALIKGFK